MELTQHEKELIINAIEGWMNSGKNDFTLDELEEYYELIDKLMF